MRLGLWIITSALGMLLFPLGLPAIEPSSKIKPPLNERFAAEGTAHADGEIPDFQQHVSPLLGRLGCNGRACHGSFQGQGGFQLSLFGYDFEADHAALLEEGAGRVDLNDKLESLLLTKPTDADEHEGGQRYEREGWEYWVLATMDRGWSTLFSKIAQATGAFAGDTPRNDFCGLRPDSSH